MPRRLPRRPAPAELNYAALALEDVAAAHRRIAELEHDLEDAHAAITCYQEALTAERATTARLRAIARLQAREIAAARPMLGREPCIAC